MLLFSMKGTIPLHNVLDLPLLGPLVLMNSC